MMASAATTVIPAPEAGPDPVLGRAATQLSGNAIALRPLYAFGCPSTQSSSQPLESVRPTVSMPRSRLMAPTSASAARRVKSRQVAPTARVCVRPIMIVHITLFASRDHLIWQRHASAAPSRSRCTSSRDGLPPAES
jgi:hypothetical protein